MNRSYQVTPNSRPRPDSRNATDATEAEPADPAGEPVEATRQAPAADVLQAPYGSAVRRPRTTIGLAEWIVATTEMLALGHALRPLVLRSLG